jgi:drug/metabolite transporter (DMT)-like permease
VAHRSDRPALGIALKLASVAVLVVMQALVKAASGDVPPGQAVFFRSAFALPVIVLWIRLSRRRLRDALSTRRPLQHLRRGLLGTLAMGLGFAGLARLPLYEVQAISYAAPLLVVVFAVLIAGERIHAVRIGAVATGLVGVLIVLGPRLGGAEASPAATLGAIMVLGGAVSAALAQVFIRQMTETEETAAIVFWFSLTATALSLLTAPFGWVVPSGAEAAMLVGAGLLGGVGQICLTAAYRYADAGVVAPFSYASMLMALGVGFALFDEVPRPSALGGAALIVAGGALVAWRERQLGLQRGRARAASAPPPG